MKTFIALLLAWLTIQICTAQITVLQEDFTNYIGTPGTAPAGWHISNHDYYNTVASSGTSGPNSMRFSLTGSSELVSPQFACGDTLRFWLKNNGVSTPNTNFFQVFESADSVNWNQIANLDPQISPGNGLSQTYTFLLLPTSKWVKFVYLKWGGGNLAFDDVRVIAKKIAYCGTNNGLFTSCGEVCFKDSSLGNPISWSWNFGNGNVSPQQNPCHTYIFPGTYSVTLTVCYPNNVCYMYSIQIEIYPNTQAAFSLPTLQCQGDTTCFTDQSTSQNANVTSWKWYFGDGDSSMAQHPCHLYDTNSVFNVTLIATNNYGCSDTTTAQQTIAPSPVADFTYTIIGNTINFTDLTIINAGIIYWNWNFDNLGSSQQQHPTFTFPGNGNYEVCLSITSDQWCYDSVCKTILITGVSEYNLLAQVQVFPTPFSERLNVKNIFSEKAEVKITSTIGEVIFVKYTNENVLEIGTEGLPIGLYFLSISDNTGNIFTKKIIKQ